MEGKVNLVEEAFGVIWPKALLLELIAIRHLRFLQQIRCHLVFVAPLH